MSKEYNVDIEQWDSQRGPSIQESTFAIHRTEARLFQWGEFTSHAGKQLPFKIECDAFDAEDWDTIAKMVMLYQTKPFSHAEGIPRGGVPFAAAMNKYASGDDAHMPMICDDIWTTGTSFREYVKQSHPSALNGWAYRWVVFARGRMDNMNQARSLFRLPEVRMV